jgi:hypothetical protein
MFELETMLKGLPDDFDGDLPLTADAGREIKKQFEAARTALRRIVSLDDKNVPKFAKQIAQDGLRLSH